MKTKTKKYYRLLKTLVMPSKIYEVGTVKTQYEWENTTTHKEHNPNEELNPECFELVK